MLDVCCCLPAAFYSLLSPPPPPVSSCSQALWDDHSKTVKFINCRRSSDTLADLIQLYLYSIFYCQENEGGEKEEEEERGW